MDSYMFKLYEMRDAINEGIARNQSIIEHQKELVKVLKEAKTTADFTQLIEGTEENTKQYQKQIDILTERIKLIQPLINDYENGKKEKADKKAIERSQVVDEIVSTLLLSLGAAEEEQNASEIVE